MTDEQKAHKLLDYLALRYDDVKTGKLSARELLDCMVRQYDCTFGIRNVNPFRVVRVDSETVIFRDESR